MRWTRKEITTLLCPMRKKLIVACLPKGSFSNFLISGSLYVLKIDQLFFFFGRLYLLIFVILNTFSISFNFYLLIQLKLTNLLHVNTFHFLWKDKWCFGIMKKVIYAPRKGRRDSWESPRKSSKLQLYINFYVLLCITHLLYSMVLLARNFCYSETRGKGKKRWENFQWELEYPNWKE